MKLGLVVDVHLVGGAHESVSFREAKAEDGVHVIFRMQPGDRREVAIATKTMGDVYTIEEGARVVISELWLPGEVGPTIVVATNP